MSILQNSKWRKGKRNASAFQTTTRKIGKTIIGKHDQLINPILEKGELISGTRMGMDSHANTTCVNKRGAHS